MDQFQLSLHALEQMELRGISEEVVFEVLYNPDKVVDEDNDQFIFQKLVMLNEMKQYMIRVFVNSGKTPNLVKTVYRSSKISKYQ